MGASTIFASGSIMSLVGQYSSMQSQSIAMKEQAASFAREQEILKVQQQITDKQYNDKRKQISGSYEAAAAHGGVKLSGSVAESLSQSLEQLNMEQSYARFNNQASMISSKASENTARRNASAAINAGYLSMGSSLLESGWNYYRYF